MLLDQIDIAAIQSSEVTQYESYDDLQEEFGNVKAVAAGAQRTLKKVRRIEGSMPYL